jgi:hypothetical protein
VRPFTSAGTGAPVLPVLGDHDGLVAGTVLPTAQTRALAVGNRALWDLPQGLSLPAGLRAASAGSPDGPPDPGAVDALLRLALQGPTVPVPADPGRRELTFAVAAAREERSPPTSPPGWRGSFARPVTGGWWSSPISRWPAPRAAIGAISRQLSYLDAQGGRPQSFAGAARDRNVILHRAPAR